MSTDQLLVDITHAVLCRPSPNDRLRKAIRESNAIRIRDARQSTPYFASYSDADVLAVIDGAHAVRSGRSYHVADDRGRGIGPVGGFRHYAGARQRAREYMLKYVCSWCAIYEEFWVPGKFTRQQAHCCIVSEGGIQ